MSAVAPEADIQAARRIACEELVDACQRAVVAVRCRTGEAASPAGVRAGLLAAELLEDILADWREALFALRAPGDDACVGPTFTPRSRVLTRP